MEAHMPCTHVWPVGQVMFMQAESSSITTSSTVSVGTWTCTIRCTTGVAAFSPATVISAHSLELCPAVMEIVVGSWIPDGEIEKILSRRPVQPPSAFC
jgi:hypothetical protein